MTTLVTVADVRRTVQTDIDDADLQDLISDEEAEVVRRFGAHGDGTSSVTETYPGDNQINLYLRRPAVSVSQITVADKGGGTPATLSASSYQLWGSQGRIEYLAGSWGDRIVNVTYVPIDDRSRRRRVIVELVRLALEQTAMKAESVAGEYSYTAPESWEAARASLYRRLSYMEV
jgi:hypothetical protein